MKIYISIEEIYPTCIVSKEKFYDRDRPLEISDEAYEWIVSVIKKYDAVQNFLDELIEDTIK